MPRKEEYEDLTGKKFNMLTVIRYMGQRGRRRTYWECLCDCGKTTIVYTGHIKSGHTTSCGCKLSQIHKNIKYLNYKNGLSGSRLGSIYCNMLSRCYRKNSKEYDIYCKRGIEVCNEWKDRKNNGFINFCNWALSNGYKDNLTLDRIDNDKGYSPNNCRWTDMFMQANNKRNTKLFTYKGEKLTLSQISKKYNIKYFSLRSRIKTLGWDIKKAIETPTLLGRNQYSKQKENYEK